MAISVVSQQFNGSNNSTGNNNSNLLVAPMKKQLVTLRIGDYLPEVCKITIPLLDHYACKIGAEFKIIDKPIFDMPSLTYEKFQLYEMSKGYDWTIFLDADTLVNPDSADYTEGVTKDIVLFHGLDMCLNRFRANNYIRRSGQVNGACTWCVMFSDWCRDIFHPIQETTWDECINNIFPTVNEVKSGTCSKEHLIDDYLVTQNIARYGLKVKAILELASSDWHLSGTGFTHLYACSAAEKAYKLQEEVKKWGLA